mmetsp:Transcript_11193/g.46703  ORF Transcript_11193/g.46703 Transcript_11193/m.46703 type:complete len:92 (+) Transcript_11193:800-1075(+)
MCSSLRRLRRSVSMIEMARAMPFMTSSDIFSSFGSDIASLNTQANTVQRNRKIPKFKNQHQQEDDAVTRKINQANECGLDVREVIANRNRS